MGYFNTEKSEKEIGEARKCWICNDSSEKLDNNFRDNPNLKQKLRRAARNSYLQNAGQSYAFSPIVFFNESDYDSTIVTTVFWARVLCSLAVEDACFRMRITLGVVLIRSLVFHVCVPECSRNGSGMRRYLLVQEKFI